MTTLIEAGEPVVLKTDEAGRVRTPAARREHLLDEYEHSGLSGAKFAALAGIKYSTFAAWVQRRRQPHAAPPVASSPATSVHWLEAVVASAQNPGGPNPASLVLQLPGGVRVEVADEKQAALAAVLVQALARPC
jgi:hypothetical protein